VLGRKTVVGSSAIIGARIVSRLFDTATMVILARVLQPTDFGIVAIAASLVAVTEAMLELPVHQGLLRLSEISRAQNDTAFTLSAMRGLLLTTLLLLAAWPFARFYGDGRLIPLVCFLSLGPVARGLISPHLARYQKRMLRPPLILKQHRTSRGRLAVLPADGRILGSAAVGDGLAWWG